MAVPDAYSETTLAQYMHQTLSDTAEALGWTVPASYEEAVTSALLLYGVADIADATNIAKLRACADLAKWNAVADVVGIDYDFSSDSQTFRRGQRPVNVRTMVKAAKSAAMRFGVDYNVISTPVTHARDPYVFRQEVG